MPWILCLSGKSLKTWKKVGPFYKDRSHDRHLSFARVYDLKCNYRIVLKKLTLFLFILGCKAEEGSPGSEGYGAGHCCHSWAYCVSIIPYPFHLHSHTGCTGDRHQKSCLWQIWWCLGRNMSLRLLVEACNINRQWLVYMDWLNIFSLFCRARKALVHAESNADMAAAKAYQEMLMAQEKAREAALQASYAKSAARSQLVGEKVIQPRQAITRRSLHAVCWALCAQLVCSTDSQGRADCPLELLCSNSKITNHVMQPYTLVSRF